MKKIILTLLIIIGSFNLSAQLLQDYPAIPCDEEIGNPFEYDDALLPSLKQLLGDNDIFLEQLINAKFLTNSLIDYAKNFIGCRYKSGAKGPTAFDCSGFTSYVFRNFGMTLSPASYMQSKQGTRINLEEAQPGDLLFFSGRKVSKKVGHVAIVVDVDKSNGKITFIHASCSRGVVIEQLPDGGYYSRRFLHANRVINASEYASVN